MIGNGVRLPEAAATTAATAPLHRLRLVIEMARGSAGELPEAWQSYDRIEDARASALKALRNPQVLRVAIVEDGAALTGSANPLHFVEWVG